MAGIRQARGQRGRSEEGGGNQKLCFLISILRKSRFANRIFGRFRFHLTAEWGRKAAGNQPHARQFLAPRCQGCLTKSQHSPAKSSAVLVRTLRTDAVASDKATRLPIDPCASRPLALLLPLASGRGAGARRPAYHARPWRLCRGIQGQVQAHPRPQGTRHHRRHLQFGLHAGVRHRADEQDLRDAEGQPRFPPGLLRQGLHLRHQGHELRRHVRPDVLLSGHREGLDPPQWRAHHRDEEDQERRAISGRSSIPVRKSFDLSHAKIDRSRHDRHAAAADDRSRSRCRFSFPPPPAACSAVPSRRPARSSSTDDRSGSGRSFASRPISATLALPVAGSSGTPRCGANMRARTSMSASSTCV